MNGADNSNHQDWIGYADQAQYVGVDDALALTAVSNTANVSVTFAARLLRKDGVVVPVNYVLTLGAAVTPVTAYWQPAQGFLLGVEAVASSGAATGCWTYAKADLTRGVAGKNSLFQSVMAGYIDLSFAFGYPRGKYQRPTDGPGTLVSVGVANPAAATDWTYTVPANTRAQLLSAYALFTPDPDSAAAEPLLEITDGTHTTAALGFYILFGPGNRQTMTLAPGLNANGNSAAPAWGQSPIPTPTILGPGWTVASLTPGISATDQWSAIQLTMLQWAGME